MNFPLRDSGYIKIRAALKRPDAFSYSNYCTVTVDLSGPAYTNYTRIMRGGSPDTLPKYPDFLPLASWYKIKNRWIANGQKDSIKNILDQFKTICHKYGIYYPLNSGELAGYVFADPNHNISKIIPSSEMNDQKEDVYYFEEYPLSQAIDAVNGCYSNMISEYYAGDFITEIFLAFCFSILLLSYRWYSKKVFLISIIGTIVWAIIFGLIGVTGGGEIIVCYSFLILFALFMLMGCINIHRKKLKVISGVLLTWSCYGIPFVVFAIVQIIDSNYYDRYYTYNSFKDKLMRRDHPIIYWIHNSGTIIYHGNLILICLFIVLCYSRLSKKWHIMPEE